MFETKIDLMPDTEIPVAVIDGRLDMGKFWPPWVSGTWPLWDYGSLPYIFNSKYVAQKAIRDPRVWAILERSYANAGLVLLADAQQTTNNNLWSNKPVRTVADFKDLKVRTPGQISSEVVQLLGAKVLSITFTEVADAMRTGIVDAMLSDFAWAFSAGFSDVSQYANNWNLGSTFPNAIVANPESFNELPPDLQGIVREMTRQFEFAMVYAMDVAELEAQMAVELVGMELIVPQMSEQLKARDMVKPVWDRWIELTGAEGAEFLPLLLEFSDY